MHPLEIPLFLFFWKKIMHFSHNYKNLYPLHVRWKYLKKKETILNEKYRYQKSQTGTANQKVFRKLKSKCENSSSTIIT